MQTSCTTKFRPNQKTNAEITGRSSLTPLYKVQLSLCQIFFPPLLNQQSEYKVFYKLMCWLGVLTCGLATVMRSPPARSRRPCYRSAGHRLFSLRMTLSRGRGWSNGLECDSKLVRCLILLSWMTSCTAGIPRSLWIISLVTYHGASTVALSILDWHRCLIAILDLEAQPHNSVPYVYIGVIMDLYSRSLLSTDSAKLYETLNFWIHIYGNPLYRILSNSDKQCIKQGKTLFTPFGEACYSLHWFSRSSVSQVHLHTKFEVFLPKFT
jgi:hypothetical protein